MVALQQYKHSNSISEIMWEDYHCITPTLKKIEKKIEERLT